jgi:hypothetical protein
VRRKLPEGEAGTLVDRHQDPELLRRQIIGAHPAPDSLFDAVPRGGDEQADRFFSTQVSFQHASPSIAF